MNDDPDGLIFWLSSQGAYTGVPPKLRAAMLRALHRAEDMETSLQKIASLSHHYDDCFENECSSLCHVHIAKESLKRISTEPERV